MKRILLLLALFLAAIPTFAQETKEKESEYNTSRDFRSKVFEVHNRDPHDIAAAVSLLGSGFKGATLNVNNQLRTITIRDFPENLAAFRRFLPGVQGILGLKIQNDRPLIARLAAGRGNHVAADEAGKF